MVTSLSKQFSFIIATFVIALATAGGLIFYYRLPENTQEQVKGISANEKQQLFESCLAGQLGPENYYRYKNGDQSIWEQNAEKLGVCYSVLSQ